MQLTEVFEWKKVSLLLKKQANTGLKKSYHNLFSLNQAFQACLFQHVFF